MLQEPFSLHLSTFAYDYLWLPYVLFLDDYLRLTLTCVYNFFFLMFVGHATAEDLVHHFNTGVINSGLSNKFLSHSVNFNVSGLMTEKFIINLRFNRSSPKLAESVTRELPHHCANFSYDTSIWPTQSDS